MRHAAVPLLATLALAACATPPAVPAPVAVSRLPVDPGLARVLGHPATVAIALLGTPGLDRREGPAQHLQFVRAGCVLDVFYLTEASRLIARHVEARTADGKRSDPVACLAAQLGARAP